MNRSSFWSTEKIVSSCAILISLMTLVVLVYQTNIMRSQQRMSVLPYLSIGNQYTGTPNFKFILTNNGIGPAFIESIVIHHKGKQYPTDLPNFYDENIPEMDSIHNIFHSNIFPGQLIPAGSVIEIFHIDNSMEDAEKLYSLLNRHDILMEIIYSSTYGEKWLITNEGGIPDKIK